MDSKSNQHTTIYRAIDEILRYGSSCDIYIEEGQYFTLGTYTEWVNKFYLKNIEKARKNYANQSMKIVLEGWHTWYLNVSEAGTNLFQHYRYNDIIGQVHKIGTITVFSHKF